MLMRMAPGFGAGHFLERAILKASHQVMGKPLIHVSPLFPVLAATIVRNSFMKSGCA